jgi:geranylgeranyl diphosphate/geranylgeranyl-bacteriochlorophyllide a reductase
MMNNTSGIENNLQETYDVIIVGGGPAGATAAHDLSRLGRSVLLIDRGGRIKPCGGAIPPRCIRDFDIPSSQIVARVTSARMVAPSSIGVDMPIENGYVGMVDREHFDEWLRERAEQSGATRLTGTFKNFARDANGLATLTIANKDPEQSDIIVKALMVIGADGAVSAVAREAMPEMRRPPFVFAYHEIVKAPQNTHAHFDPLRCDVIYQGTISPDFYGWVFPHGDTISIGTGSAHKGFSLRGSIADFRKKTGLDGLETLRKEGAPIPMKPLKRWDNGRDVILAGDAAGVVAPASGEGIYYAMFCGRLAAESVQLALQANTQRAAAKALAGARKHFMKSHGRVFWVLGLLQYFWYRNDRRREQFVKICRDPDVQKLTWESYMNKELVRGKAMQHIRIFVNDVRHLMGFARA